MDCVFFSEPKTEKLVPDDKKYYERTFISVLNDPNDVEFNKTFKVKSTTKPSRRHRCVITKY